MPAPLLPFVLRLPDTVFRILAGRMLKIDPQARSSMWEDLQQGRRTEIDYLQGAIVRIAAQHGQRAPLSERIIELVRSAEELKQGSPRPAAGSDRIDAIATEQLHNGTGRATSGWTKGWRHSCCRQISA